MLPNSSKLVLDGNVGWDLFEKAPFSSGDSTITRGGRSDIESRIAAIWRDMRERWSRNQPLPAEHYLQYGFPEGCDETDAIDIIYAEFALMDEYGRSPLACDFIERFPQYEEALRKQLALHDGLQPAAGETRNFSGMATSDTGIRPPHVVLPAQFGKLTLVALLDSGGQSDVYRAVHPGLAKEVVVKIERHQEGPVGASHHDRLLEEARLLAGLSHPNLIRVLDAGVHEGRAFLVLEYIRGRTLNQYSREHKPTPREAAKLVAKIADAVASMHAVGVLHLDIKPKNILVDESGEPHLLDLGLSRWDSSWTSHEKLGQGVSGTLGCMSPEQVSGDSEAVGPQADIFSLGAVLYFLLTRQPLYPQQPLLEMLQTVRECAWNRGLLEKSNAGRRLIQACCKALDVAPQKRYSTAESLARALVATHQPANKWLIAAAVVPLLVVYLICFSPGQIGTPAAKLPAIVPSLNLNAQVFRDKRWWPLHQSVPLRNGVDLQVRAVIPAHHDGRLFLLTSENKVRQLAHTASRDQEQNLTFPSELQGAPLIGKPGTECLFVVSGAQELPTEDELTAHFQSSPDWPELPEYTILHGTAKAIETEQGTKDLGIPTDRPTAETLVRRRLESLRKFLQDRNLSFEAIAFSHSR